MNKSLSVTVDKDLEDIVPLFLDNRKKDIDEIKAFLADDDISPHLSKIQSIGHKLAGNAASYGFDDLGDLGAKIEEACLAGEKDNVKILCEDYCTYIESVEVNYSKK